MEKYKVLVCDDDIAVRYSLEDCLISEGFEALCVSNAERLLDEIQHQFFDVIVLDIMLPGMNGLDACKEIRKICDTPIIMLSAKGTINDRITGLETGADDYVPKPFSPREVIIRIKRILNRSALNPKPHTLSLEELTVYPEKNQAVVNEVTIGLTIKELQVLLLLLNNVGKICTRDHILNEVWGYDYLGDTRVVDTLIKRIRKKIILKDVHFSINSVYGAGYKLEKTG
ncbi:MAG: response regulator transcription factor [Clostridiales bacterium]|nr:response regulator transcription factor [Clostridiales bacterium]